MQKKALISLLNKMGIIPVRDDGTWLTISCPVAYRYHDDKDDKNPSCGVSYGNGISVMNCFACGTRRLESILFILYSDKKISKDVLRFYMENKNKSEVDPEIKKVCYSDIFADTDDMFKDVIVSDIVFKRMMPAYKSLKVRGYFKKRNISEDFLSSVYFWSNGIVFPIKDTKGIARALHYKPFSNSGNYKYWFLEPKHFGLTGAWPKNNLWYGLESIDWSKPVILVEGEFDVLRLKTLGFLNVLGCCGSLSDRQLMLLKSYNPVWVYIGFDNDETGRRYTERAKRRLRNYSILDWGILGIKDAGDLKSQDDLQKVFHFVKK